MSAQPYPDVRALGTFDEVLGVADDKWTATTNASLAPTKQEQEAIQLLKDQDAAIVCAYLRVARALEGGSRLGNGQSVLTDDEVHAIFALSGHKDAIVWSWLADAQGAINHNHFERLLSRDIARDPTEVNDALHSSTRFPAAFPDSTTDQSTDTPRLDSKIKTNRQPATQYRSQSDLSNDPVLAGAENVSRPYSCTICGSQRSYQNHYDWKKHEKEHEAKYICMAGNSQNAPPIINGKTETHRACNFSCKRRDHMVTHLNRGHEIHNVPQARLFADQWRCTSGKKFWSCGFCICLFTGFAERLKHIGSEHYERTQTYDEWDTTKLIKGLLLQPEVQRAWKSILATGPKHRSGELVWEARTIEKTQYLLEMGPSPTQSAESLAMVAYKAGKLRAEPPQPASALSITATLGDVVETDFGNTDVMIDPPVSLHASVEHMLAQFASNDTSVPSASSAYWAASTGHMLNRSYHQANPSEGQAHMPDGSPSSEYGDWLSLGPSV